MSKVHSPDHYTKGGIEAIDYIKAKLGPEGFRAYCLGNVMKYVSRWQDKDGEQDLHKALKYMEWAVNNKEGEWKQQQSERHPGLVLGISPTSAPTHGRWTTLELKSGKRLSIELCEPAMSSLIAALEKAKSRGLESTSRSLNVLLREDSSGNLVLRLLSVSD